jgi:hypothetical protein
MNMASVFADVPDWPSPSDRMLGQQPGSNQPPLEERLMMEFEEDLAKDGITARVAELLASAQRCPATIEDDATAGKVGDLCRLARDVEKRISDARERHNRPLLNAQRALKSKADGVFVELSRAVADVRARLNAYVQKKEREAAEERRRQEEEARKAREAMEQAGVDHRLVETVTTPTPTQERGPVARGDLGSAVSGRTVWKHEIEVPIAKLPKTILEAAPVREAVEKVIAATIRAGNREIKGVRIWSEQEASVR